MATGKGFDKGVITTSVVHHRIHQGSFFSISAIDAAVAASGFLTVLVRVPSGSCHIRFVVTVSGNALGNIYEAPTTTADGTLIVPANRNRFSSRVAECLFFSGPTVTDKGTLLEPFLLSGGSGGNAPGSRNSGFEEWLLAPGDYLMEIQNITAQVQAAAIQMDFYEPPEGIPRI